ncbi:MAG: hypothetical protein J6Y43_07705 [Clostridia bacterium]|nr:hypothetical protein [Clostridia bacterium]
MKKIVIPILIVVLILVTGIAVFFGVKANVNNNEAKSARSEITLIQDKYNVGDNIVFQFVSFNSKKITTLKYVFNNGDEVTINGIHYGETADYKGAKSTDEKFYVDSGVVVIATDEMDTGWYHLTFYGYDEEDNKIELNSTPYLFKLVAAQSNAAN